MVLPVDTPNISLAFMQYLLLHIETDHQMVVPVNNNKTEPLTGIYRTSALEIVREQIAVGHYAVNKLVYKLNAKLVEAKLPDFEPSVLFKTLILTTT
ncbi:MAG: hypothetical protein HC896_03960 [Bacteroidales bacterium]|nr:hypothetical protein [Bacteroidales bacterium]